MAGFFRRLLGKDPGDPIIVVSGLPRSGTSMAMKMLEAGGVELAVDGIRTADEDNPKGYYELERVKDLDKPGDKSWLRETRGKGVKIISFLLKDLPRENRYKVLFMTRHLDEVLASQTKMLDRRGEDTETQDDRMRDLYENHLLQVKGMLSRKENFEALYIHYSDVLADGRPHAEKIAAFLGGGLDVDAMAAVVDQALYRNRSKSG